MGPSAACHRRLEWIKLARIEFSVIGLNQEFIPAPKQETPASVPQLIRALKNGTRSQKEAALLNLIIFGAEDELTDCLSFPDPVTATLATAGVWECWLNEEG